MKQHRRWVAVVGLACGVGALLLTAVVVAEGSRAEEAGDLPPLEISSDAPQLLDGPQPQPEGPAADNGPCFVCHANYREEPLAVWHARENIGCVDCHGRSFAHRNDENNTTPPDVMYPRAKIDPGCLNCHPRHDVPARDVVQLFLQRCDPQMDAKKLACTDCHGEHRLSHRTVRWNKTTRKLLPPEDGSCK